MKVFVENEAGSNVKHLHDEKSLQVQGTMHVYRPYPFPYGFVLDTTAEDGDNADCFILTNTPLRTGEIVECEPVALMEQIEDGQADHKVLAFLRGDERPVERIPVAELTEFVTHVFEHIPGKSIAVGEFKDKDAALSYLHDCQDAKPTGR
ncbi:MAG TPA: inorganic diphosphatase [Candidatus Angelobacter sp.]|nr:inorganic diphosphatase [Candidatus Angelobacter sp.]